MGIGELLIIAVIGLLVLGPERLPVAIRTVSQWVKSAKQMANSISSEMTHELNAHELHQNLKKAEEQGMKNLSPELTRSVQELKDAAASVNQQYQQFGQDVTASGNDDKTQDVSCANATNSTDNERSK
jgi:sec-independent protein translocase protein TatB